MEILVQLQPHRLLLEDAESHSRIGVQPFETPTLRESLRHVNMAVRRKPCCLSAADADHHVWAAARDRLGAAKGAFKLGSREWEAASALVAAASLLHIFHGKRARRRRRVACVLFLTPGYRIVNRHPPLGTCLFSSFVSLLYYPLVQPPRCSLSLPAATCHEGSTRHSPYTCFSCPAWLGLSICEPQSNGF